MEVYGEEACDRVSETFPICEKHLDRLSEELGFRPAEHMRDNHLEKGDEAFVFNRRNGEVYSLNGSAAFLLKGLMAGKSGRALLEELSGKFEIASFKEAINGLREFVDELVRLGLGEKKNGKKS